MNDNIKIGLRIKALRESKGLTQGQLGEFLGLNKSSIQRYETGKIAKIKLPILENIAFILDVNPSYLALKTDDPNYYGEAAGVPGSLLGSLPDDPVPSTSSVSPSENEKTAPPSEDDAVVQEILNIIKALPTDKKRKFLEAIKNLASM